MLQVKKNLRYVGAYFVDLRHLNEMDRIIDRLSIEESSKSVAVVLEGGRSFRTRNFSDIPNVDENGVVDRLPILSLDGEVKGAMGYISLSISDYGLLAKGLLSELDADAFEKAVVDLRRNIRAPYDLLFRPYWGAIILFVVQVLMSFFVVSIVTKYWHIAQTIINSAITFGVVSAAIQSLVTLIQMRTPRFILLVGEGLRFRDRKMWFWKWLLPRASWQLLVLVIIMVAGIVYANH